MSIKRVEDPNKKYKKDKKDVKNDQKSVRNQELFTTEKTDSNR